MLKEKDKLISTSKSNNICGFMLNEAKYKFISSVDQESKEDCLSSLEELFVELYKCDISNKECSIIDISNDNDFIMKLKTCLEQNDEVLFRQCSLFIELLSSISNDFNKNIFASGFLPFYIEKAKEFKVEQMEIILPILCNIAIDIEEVPNILIFNDIFDVLNMFDDCDLEAKSSYIVFLKSFLLLLNEDQQEVINTYMEKVFIIMEEAISATNEDIVCKCIQFFNEMENSDGDKNFLIEPVSLFIIENLTCLTTDIMTLTFRFFNSLFDNEILNGEVSIPFDSKLIVDIVMECNEDNLLEQIFMFANKACKYSQEIVHNLTELFDFTQLLDILMNGGVSVKMTGLELICTLILKVELKDLLNKFMFEELIEFMIEIDQLDNTSSCSLHSMGALTRLYIATDGYPEIKDIIEPYIID